MESFGLVPDQLNTHTATSGEQINIQFGEGMSQGSPQPVTTRIPDEFCAMQSLYLLDHFGVSDEFYHELTQVKQIGFYQSRDIRYLGNTFQLFFVA